MKRIVKRRKTNYTIFLLGMIAFVTFFLGVGYAQIANINLGISGSATSSVPNAVFISDADIDTTSPADISNSIISNIYLTMMQSTVILNQNRNSTLSIDVTIHNKTSEDVYFDNVVYESGFYDNNNIDFTLSGLSHGQKLSSNDSVTFTITFKYSDAYLATNPSTFDSELNSYINFKFLKGYTITYTGFSSTTGLDTVILENQTITETFTSTNGIPYNVNVSGCTSSYSSPTLTLSNPTGNVTVNRIFSITYTAFTGSTSGLASTVTSTGTTITFDSTTGIPVSVTVSGATGSYSSPTLTLSNITDNVTITASFGGNTIIDDQTTTYDPNNVPANSTVTYTAIDGEPKVTTDANGNITSFEYTAASAQDPVSIQGTPVETGFIPFTGSTDWELTMTFRYASEDNSSTSAAKNVSILGCTAYESGSLVSGFAFRLYNMKNASGSLYKYNNMLKYKPQLYVENNGSSTILYGLFTTNSSGTFMTSPMTYTIHITKVGNNMTFQLTNGAQLTYHPTSNSNTGFSTAAANTTQTATWTDNNSSANVDITIGAYQSSSGTLAQQAVMDVISFNVHKTN